jgi:uncharacterized protein YciI
MLYAIICEDVPDSLALRMSARPAHLERLQNMLTAGRIILAGPHPAVDNDDPGAAGFTGSLIIASFDSLADAEAWARDDPYTKVGVFRKVTVKPFKKVLP